MDVAAQMAKSSKRDITQDDMQEIISICASGELEVDYFKEKLVAFSGVINGMRGVSALDYIKAIQYCSFIATGDTQYDAYCKTHPDRVAAKACDGTVRASANLYHKTDLVQKIIGMTEIPLHMIFMSVKYRAVEKLVHLMDSSASDRIQMESADKLLTHLRTPETSKIQIDIGVKSNETMDSLDKTLMALAQKHVDMISSGVHTAKDIVDAEILDGNSDS
jgi:hypothetical protein